MATRGDRDHAPGGRGHSFHAVRPDAFTLGPRAGFFSGWALLGTYLAFTAASTTEVGLFGQAFFDGTGIWPDAEWLVISLVAAALIWFVAYGDVRVVTRALLGMEGLTVTLIVIVVVVIFTRVLAGSAPDGQDFTLSPFTLPSGVGIGTVALAAVFGLLSFAGFEGAASLGEETDNPRRDIPHAIATAVITMGVFYTIVMLAQTLGFGVDKQGTESFAGSSSPLGELSKSYVGPIMADAINFGVMVSAFASALGTATAGSRMLFALCRDGFLSRSKRVLDHNPTAVVRDRATQRLASKSLLHSGFRKLPSGNRAGQHFSFLFFADILKC